MSASRPSTPSPEPSGRATSSSRSDATSTTAGTTRPSTPRGKPPAPGGALAAFPSVNIAVVSGLLITDPVVRELPSGDLVAELSVRTTDGDGRTVTAPVAWHRPGQGVHRLHQDAHVLIVGRVARRFFRSGGQVVSRTEIVAGAVVRPSQKVTWQRALATAQEKLAALHL